MSSIHDSTFNRAGRDQSNFNLNQTINVYPQGESFPPGTGKSTIAYTAADACRAHGVLDASFFCSRDDADCSNPNLIFTTIAYQLGISNPSFRAEVTRVMKLNPDIRYTTPPYQLEELIINPLRTLRNSISPCIVVLDALDECKDAGMTSVILSSLSRHIDDLSPLKFLITSRPETHITSVFKSNELEPVTRPYFLHEVVSSVVQSDMKHYLSTKLALTRKLYRIKDEWPSEADIHSLTVLSSALFIFASTSVKFIEDRNYSNPREQLARLLCNTTTATEPSSPDYGLNQLYTQVLNDAFPHCINRSFRSVEDDSRHYCPSSRSALFICYRTITSPAIGNNPRHTASSSLEFCSKYLLYWVEALSLIGDLRNALLALKTAQQAIAKAGRDVTDTMILLRDCERFTLEFFPIINTKSVQWIG